MRIRLTIILTALPFFAVTLTLSLAGSLSAALKGMDRIHRELFDFKAENLRAYAEEKWLLLRENHYAERPEMISAAAQDLFTHARSLITGEGETIFAVDAWGTLAASTGPLEIRADEREPLLKILEESEGAAARGVIDGKPRALRGFYCIPLGWYLVISEERQALYRELKDLIPRALGLAGAALLIGAALLSLLARRLSKPVEAITGAAGAVGADLDLSARAEVIYPDETGALARSFNAMMSLLERLYKEIKHYAFKAALAERKERRMKGIFQKYAPKSAAEAFAAGANMSLAGETRELAVLFSDIKGFSGLCRRMGPDETVRSLNRYFTDQTEIVVKRNGMVDKYVGDSLAAFWGAPLAREDDPSQAVSAALDMIEALKEFNRRQEELGKPDFAMGVGVSFGNATVGNIGSQRRTDYTILGDTVASASALADLTGVYKEDLLISEPLYERIQQREPKLPARLIDCVEVKGRELKIYAVRKAVTVPESKAWGYYREGMSLYCQRSFEDAAQQFKKALIILHDDRSAEILLARCLAYAENPPPPEWNGFDAPPVKGGSPLKKGASPIKRGTVLSRKEAGAALSGEDPSS
ncbi:MAG: adenylate/guanylate cyclase domain-containing protein [Spirochaetaceae bacterium]|jgi:class 3 adenylate cyclase/HAMP domain-containing protein|nr:adenylate/guanylate cyclase domain-containing protein [Spirochaetaceae bacterium]